MAVDSTILYYNAFQYFGYNLKLIQIKGYVNMNDLNKRFRKYALLYHPDRNINNNDMNDKQIKIEWTNLCKNYGVLKGLCERSQKNKDKIVSNVAKWYQKSKKISISDQSAKENIIATETSSLTEPSLKSDQCLSMIKDHNNKQ